MRRFAFVLLALPLFGCSRTISDVVTKMQWDPSKGDLRVVSCSIQQEWGGRVDVDEVDDHTVCKTTTMHLADPNPDGGAPVSTSSK